MIIIFNIMGLLFGLLGLFVGAILLGTTGFLTMAIVGIASVWCFFGRSKLDPETGAKRPAPAVFFIPLFYWGILVGICVFPAVLFDFIRVTHPEQAIASGQNQVPGGGQGPVKLERDEEGLKTNESDDPQLSQELLLMMAHSLPGVAVNICVKSSSDSVLVLMKLPDLKKVREPDRIAILNGIRELVESQRPGVKVFAGIKGKMFYGAVVAPDHPAEAGATVPKSRLFGFYRSNSAPAAVESDVENPSTPVDPASTPTTSDTEKTSENSNKPESEPSEKSSMSDWARSERDYFLKSIGTEMQVTD